MSEEDNLDEWQLGVVFAVANIFLLLLGGFAIVALGLVRGMAIFLLSMFLVIYIIYQRHVSQHED